MSEPLSDEEQVERIKRWWGENGTSLIVGLVVAIGGVVGWNWYKGYSAERSAAAYDAYAEYVESRSIGAPVEEVLAGIDSEFEGTAYRVFTLLHRAKDAADEQDWEAAHGHLALAVQTADDEYLEEIARLRLAKVEFQLGRFDDALATVSQVHGKGHEATVSELSGDIFKAQGNLDAARDAYRAGVDAADGTPAVGLLRLKLASLTQE